MLKGKIALITGSGRGIGEAVSHKMAAYGAKIVAADVNEKNALETANSINVKNGEAIAIKVDITSKTDCEAGVKATIEKYGALDILVNCAGINTASLLKDISEELWDRILDVNLKGMLFMTQAAAGSMIDKRYGRIVNIGSIAGKIGEPMNGAYCVSKAGVHMLTQVFGLELAEYGITVNAVSPGPTDTIIMKEVFEQRGPIMGMSPEEFKEKFLSDIPLKRMASPVDIAEFISFLASDRASYVTGCSYTIAGGKILI